MALELQPVILAAGEGSKMFPLTENIPKCLMPIGNMPMIWYVVNQLERSGFQDFIVIVRSNDASLVQQTLQSLCLSSSTFDFIKLQDDEDFGTCDALRLLKSKIKSDILVASCDLISEAPVHRLVDIHRIYDASITVMLSKPVELQLEKDVTAANQHKSASHIGNKDVVSIDTQENRLLYFANEGDIESDNIVFKKSMMKRYSNIKLLTNLVDCHLYIMKKWILEYIASNNKLENIKSDAIPLIVRKQFSVQKKSVKDMGLKTVKSDDSKDIHSFLPSSKESKYITEYSSYQGSCLKDSIKCHVYVSDSFCLRVNTIPSYIFMNRQLSKLKDIAPNLEYKRLHPTTAVNEKSQIGNDCLVGESTTCAQNTSIKKSVIGKHCVICSNVRITNCIIMNHVTISSGSNLHNSIICDNCYIQENASLTNCQVSAGQTVKENRNLKNEVVVSEEMGFEE
ncbi:translation initiation factor eIF2B subunit gamma isoform X1 [Hydra vulgaris]|uniref:translation initiation factor eIF2B subunit gamma isoform X1 n=1 Tax=Hydra vulgaris TaxID=6087 RepID=UPI001F5EFA70|nr:translation initiation factor eIF-2B subunit gamma [Hydra vulgaris]